MNGCSWNVKKRKPRNSVLLLINHIFPPVEAPASKPGKYTSRTHSTHSTVVVWILSANEASLLQEIRSLLIRSDRKLKSSRQLQTSLWFTFCDSDSVSHWTFTSSKNNTFPSTDIHERLLWRDSWCFTLRSQVLLSACQNKTQLQLKNKIQVSHEKCWNRKFSAVEGTIRPLSHYYSPPQKNAVYEWRRLRTLVKLRRSVQPSKTSPPWTRLAHNLMKDLRSCRLFSTLMLYGFRATSWTRTTPGHQT